MEINKRDLLEEIALLLKDEFVANVNTVEDEICLSFLSGQKFSISVKEVL